MTVVTPPCQACPTTPPAAEGLLCAVDRLVALLEALLGWFMPGFCRDFAAALRAALLCPVPVAPVVPRPVQAQEAATAKESTRRRSGRRTPRVRRFAPVVQLVRRRVRARAWAWRVVVLPEPVAESAPPARSRAPPWPAGGLGVAGNRREAGVGARPFSIAGRLR